MNEKEYIIEFEFVCDECCLPLSLYGENTILASEGDKIITKLFCDLHTFEFLEQEYDYDIED